MLSIRLSRVGRKKAPVYRVVVMPKHRDPYGKVNEIVGHYNPRTKPRELTFKADRIKYWIEHGAQPTDTVWNLLVDEKIVEGDKRGASHISKKRAGRMEAKDAEAKEKAEAAAAKAAEAKAAEEAAAAEAKAAPAEETPAEAPAEEAKTEEAPAEEPKAEEAPKEEEEKKEDAPAEEKAE